MRWSEPPDEQIPSPQQKQIAATTLRAPWPVTVALAIALALGPLAFTLITKSGSTTPPVLSVPAMSNGWEASSAENTWKPAFANPSTELQTSFKQGEQVVGLYIGYYRNQDFDSKLVSSTNVLVTSKDPEWSVVVSGTKGISIATQNLNLRTSELLRKGSGSESRLTVWQWYWINGSLTSSDIEAKFYTAFNRLLGKGDDSAVIMIYAPKNSAEASQKALTEFVTVNGENLQKMLNQTRDKP
jgi:EpsI family protein